MTAAVIPTMGFQSQFASQLPGEQVLQEPMAQSPRALPAMMAQQSMQLQLATPRGASGVMPVQRIAQPSAVQGLPAAMPMSIQTPGSQVQQYTEVRGPLQASQPVYPQAVPTAPMATQSVSVPAPNLGDMVPVQVQTATQQSEAPVMFIAPPQYVQFPQQAAPQQAALQQAVPQQDASQQAAPLSRSAEAHMPRVMPLSEAAPVTLIERASKPPGWSALWDVLPLPPPPPPLGEDGVWVWVPEGEDPPQGGYVPHGANLLPPAAIDDFYQAAPQAQVIPSEAVSQTQMRSEDAKTFQQTGVAELLSDLPDPPVTKGKFEPPVEIPPATEKADAFIYSPDSEVATPLDSGSKVIMRALPSPSSPREDDPAIRQPGAFQAFQLPSSNSTSFLQGTPKTNPRERLAGDIGAFTSDAWRSQGGSVRGSLEGSMAQTLLVGQAQPAFAPSVEPVQLEGTAFWQCPQSQQGLPQQIQQEPVQLEGTAFWQCPQSQQGLPQQIQQGSLASAAVGANFGSSGQGLEMTYQVDKPAVNQQVGSQLAFSQQAVSQPAKVASPPQPFPRQFGAASLPGSLGQSTCVGAMGSAGYFNNVASSGRSSAFPQEIVSQPTSQASQPVPPQLAAASLPGSMCQSACIGAMGGGYCSSVASGARASPSQQQFVSPPASQAPQQLAAAASLPGSMCQSGCVSATGSGGFFSSCGFSSPFPQQLVVQPASQAPQPFPQQLAAASPPGSMCQSDCVRAVGSGGNFSSVRHSSPSAQRISGFGVMSGVMGANGDGDLRTGSPLLDFTADYAPTPQGLNQPTAALAPHQFLGQLRSPEEGRSSAISSVDSRVGTWRNDPNLARVAVAQIAERNRRLLDVTAADIGGQIKSPGDD
eukprot:TRINITY_DN8236_c0_g1_i1.p1 TRINITY_DN8236_c0_g1~~TRINITY_DN8236_c0_g1_i1.p1  ORF type:complete len:872 (+),score=166.84 TRINITY_DN8236_c0_g1_i1:56-2671(+)